LSTRTPLTLFSCRDSKRRDREARFASLSPQYHAPFSAADKAIINKPIEELVQDVQKGVISPVDVVRTYGKVAVKAQEKTNCITELLLPEAEEWATSEVNLKGPLAGIPVSLKDSIQVKGFDITLGYTSKAYKPYQDDGAIVKLLKDAGQLFQFP
jgi:Asp-tRNA(Asn)/Glu-tRNA(Gln) amidotransferase A subunit family amidase